MTKESFKQKLAQLTKAPSISGRANYLHIKVVNDFIFFTRQSTGTEESIAIDELYQAYKNETFLNTIILRKYIAQRRYSPALAILVAAGVFDKNGNRN